MTPSHDGAGPGTDALLRLQREANEKLVLRAIRDQELADAAVEAVGRVRDEAQTLRTSEEELRSTAEFRERLIGIIGHDLRGPLNTMVMAAKLMIAHGNLTDEDVRLGRRVATSGQRIARMLSQLVGFTRARLGGGFPLQLACCNLGDVCQDIVEELQVVSSVDIGLVREGDLTGAWDPGLLAEAVSNIAGNAVDHAAPGTQVRVRVYEDDGAVFVEVTNEGACIPAEVFPVIFTAFGRGRVDENESTEHLGLGLYVASEVVRAHGGTIAVRSSEGTTTFTMRLPRVLPPLESGGALGASR